MAEEKQTGGADETASLQKLIDGDDEGAQEEGKEGTPLAKLFKKLFGAIIQLFKTKKMIMIPLAVVLLLAVGAGGYFLFKTKAVQEEAALPPAEEAEAPAKEEEEEELHAKGPSVYKLDPFFLPLYKEDKKTGRQETGQFINLSVFLSLSNRKLYSDLDKNIIPLRQDIYNLLNRRDMNDYLKKNQYDKRLLEAKLRDGIVASANTLLLPGRGEVEDAFFTLFIVK